MKTFFPKTSAETRYYLARAAPVVYQFLFCHSTKQAACFTCCLYHFSPGGIFYATCFLARTFFAFGSADFFAALVLNFSTRPAVSINFSSPV
ncbi:MAG: hypothetical protein RIQ54_197 [Candidatus Parcubacteria bacterium]